MARKKAYNEEEVIEKATELFWNKGFEMTSMRSLEQAMGINKFSIYSSFGSKQGVFLKSIKCYINKTHAITDKLKTSLKGTEAIKDFFYDFLEFSKNNNNGKGCLLTNTSGELGVDGDKEIMSEIYLFANNLKSIFIEKLKSDKSKDEKLIIKQANYLLIAKQGLSNASKVFEQQILEDFIEMSFEKI